MANCDEYCKGEDKEVTCEEYSKDSIKLEECRMACMDCDKPLKTCFCPALITKRIGPTIQPEKNDSVNANSNTLIYVLIGVIILILLVLLCFGLFWYWRRRTKSKNAQKVSSHVTPVSTQRSAGLSPYVGFENLEPEISVQDEKQNDEKSPP